MTIACGLMCLDGVILCADTQITADYKQQAQKVWLFTVGDVSVGVTGAGDYVLLKLAAEQIGKRIHGGMDVDTIRHGVVEPVLASIFKDHIDKAPDWVVQHYGYDLALIVGIRIGKTFHLFDSSRTSIGPIANYRCVGSGSPVGNYIAGTMFTTQLSVFWGQALAAYLIQQTKVFGLDCGGDTNIAILPDIGPSSFLSPAQTARAEKVGSRIHEALGLGLFRATSPEPFTGGASTFGQLFEPLHAAVQLGVHELYGEEVAHLIATLTPLAQRKEDQPVRKAPKHGRKSRKPSRE